MDTTVRTTSKVIEEFAEYAHEAVDAFRARAVALEGNLTNMSKMLGESGKALGVKFPEGSKLGSYVENNPAKFALYSFMTAMMFTHFMKGRGVNIGWDAPEAAEKADTGKPRSAKRKAA